VAEVEDPVAQVEHAERGHGANDPQNGGHPEYDAHVPRLGLIAVADVVVGDGQDGPVVEQASRTICMAVTGKKLKIRITSEMNSRTRSVSAIR